MIDIPFHLVLSVLFLVFAAMYIGVGIFSELEESLRKRWTFSFVAGSAALLALQGLLVGFGFKESDHQHTGYLVAFFLPPTLFFAWFLFSKQLFSENQLSLKHLTLVQIFRAPLNLIILWLISKSIAPDELIGPLRYFGLFIGISSVIVWQLWKSESNIGRSLMFVWNIAGLVSLGSWFFHTITLLPGEGELIEANWIPYQFPLLWLPGFLSPLLLFSHFYSLKYLMHKNISEG